MAEDRLGPVRIQGAYAWRKLLDSGARIANGSDFPVEHPNPFYGLHASVTRQDQQSNPRVVGILRRHDAEETLASFTIDAAYAGHQEAHLVLELAKRPISFCSTRISSRNLPQMWQTLVLETWVDGVESQYKTNENQTVEAVMPVKNFIAVTLLGVVLIGCGQDDRNPTENLTEAAPAPLFSVKRSPAGKPPLTKSLSSGTLGASPIYGVDLHCLRHAVRPSRR